MPRKKGGNKGKEKAKPSAAAAATETPINGDPSLEEDTIEDGDGTASAAVTAKTAIRELKKEIEKSPRMCTGVLTSSPLSRDIKIESFSLLLHGYELISETKIELNYGRRYGLIGLNGSGKSHFLACIGNREVPVPKHIDMFYLEREIDASDKTALQCVVEETEIQRKLLEAEADVLSATEAGANSERLYDIYEKLDELDVNTATARAGKILHGLGFSHEMQNTKTRDFSGGWRMRISLAKALFLKPSMLLLDEPTNHLDLGACVWLEEYLKDYNRILVIVSHSQDFLNNVCTNIINLHNKTLNYYTGNFDAFVKTRSELETNQMKQFAWEQDQILKMKDYIARFGHGNKKMAAQAKSKEKVLAKMEAGGLTEKVVADKVLTLQFEDPGTLHPPVIQVNTVTFGYPGGRTLYKDLEFGVDLDSRVALVGPNGVGKSTLLKLMVGDLHASIGMVRRHHHARLGYFHQHLTDILDVKQSALEFMMQAFPEVKEQQEMRASLGRFGITRELQTSPMLLLSDGQKRRVLFAWLAFKQPHVLLLDEPTNHLDIETIDSLAQAIREFAGGLVLVSHDFRLINQVAKEIWVCENQGITKWKGDITTYKQHLKEQMGL